MTKRERGPRDIPPRGWWQVIKRAVGESRADNVPIVAGGVAFFGFVGLFPALIAVITVYGLVADPERIAEQVERIATALPPSARQVIVDQLETISRTSDRAVTLGLVLSLIVTLWTASVGMSNLIRAVNLSYDDAKQRGIVRLRATGLGLTLGAIMFVLVALVLIAVVPAVVDLLALGRVGRVLIGVLRWVLLVGVLLVGLAVLYRIAPVSRTPRIRWVVPGAVVATALWLLGGLVFSLYVRWFGTYDKYGVLAGVVVLMLGLWLVSFAVLLGAEINAEAERQPIPDTDQEGDD